MKRNAGHKGRTPSNSHISCISALALLILPAFISCDMSEYSEEIAGDIGHTFSPLSGNCHTIELSGMRGKYISGIKTVDIFIYNDDGMMRLDSYQRCMPDMNGKVTAASRSGKKIIAAIANPQNDTYIWDEVSSFESLCSMTSSLCLEDKAFPLMTGTGKAGDGTGNCKIIVEPVMSRIQVRSIKCDFSGRPYANAYMENVCIYLANANSLHPMFGKDVNGTCAPLNVNGFPDEGLVSVADARLLYAEFAGRIGNVAVYPGISLFCYPNESTEEGAGSPFTRLVISGDILGERYYYPININRGDFDDTAGGHGIARNTEYVLDITLRRTGSSDPMFPLTPGTADVKIDRKPWKYLPENEIEF